MYKHFFPFFDKKVNSKELIYFDAACTYIKNKATIEGINRYYTDYSCCSGDRESSYLGSLLQGEIDETRKLLKKFIGAGASDYVLFTSSTTDGINKVVSGIDEDLIGAYIVSDLEHNSNFLPQKEWAKRKGIDFHIIPYADVYDSAKLEKFLVALGKPFLLSITQASNILGGVFDIKQVSQTVHDHGGYILVDDAQYITFNKEDVCEKDIDFCVFSSHKLGGPTGIGVLYIKENAKKILKYSQQLGGGTVKKISDSTPTYKELPYFLEGGVQNFGGILGLKGCLEFLQEVGVGDIHKHILDLSKTFLATLQEKYAHEFDVVSLADSSLISVVPKNFSVLDFHQYTNFFSPDFIVAFRTGTMCADNFVNTYLKTANIARFSFGIYNTQQDITQFFYILDSYLKKSK